MMAILRFPVHRNSDFVINVWFLIGVLCILEQHRGVRAISEFPKVLVISMDAFRHDYVEDCVTPTIIKLRSSGVFAPFMKNVFPTKTFPNHHSIATGVYPGVHGVLDSSVLSSKEECKNRTVLGYSYELFHYDTDILPVWTLNQAAGKGRHSGVMMWPGGEFPYGCKKTMPTFYQKLDFNISFYNRVDTVISWFTHPKTPANFVMLYFEEPDLHGHAFGIESLEVRQQIKNLDKVLEYLSQQLQKHGLNDDITVFVLSDHGMISLNQQNIIDLNKYVDNSTYVFAGSSPVLQIFPNKGKEDLVLSKLQEASQKNKNMFDVFSKDEIPSMWHYTANNRTPPILVVAKIGYAFQDFYNYIADLNSKFHIESNPRNKYGIHGYSNTQSEMFPFFFAWGSLVKSGVVLEPFRSIELFPTWAHILALDVEDGNYSMPLLSMLRDANNTYFKTPTASQVPILGGVSKLTYGFVGLVAIAIFITLIGVIVHFCRNLRQQRNGESIPHRSYRNIMEDQHLLFSESDDDFKI